MLKYRLIGIIIGVAVGSLLFILPLKGSAYRYTLLSECSGDIDSVVIHYHKDLERAVHTPIDRFITALDRSVKVIFICSSQMDTHDAKKSYNYPNARYLSINKSITGWSKDRFLTTDSNKPYFLSSRIESNGIPGRNNDFLVPEFLADQQVLHSLSNRRLDLTFDAGDILCSGSKTIVSDVLAEKNKNIQNIANYLSTIFNGDVVYLHDVPRHHIGMFAAPISDKEVVVGDVKMCSDRIRKKFIDADFSPATAKQFDNAASQLRQAGYTVHRIPTIVFDEKTFITYTNGVFESRRVFMPVYGIPEIDLAAEHIYESLGLKVVPIPVGKLYKLHGTIGCLVNVIKRRN